MLKNLTLKFSSPEEVTLDSLGTIVLVGPNNSGKSLLLRELALAVEEGLEDGGSTKIIKSIEFGVRSKEQFDSLVNRYHSTPPPDEDNMGAPKGILYFAARRQRGPVIKFEGSLEDLYTEMSSRSSAYATRFARIDFVNLDGASRLNLTREQEDVDLDNPRGVLAALYTRNDLRREVQSAVFDAFGRYLIVDPSKLGKLRVKMALEMPPRERSLEDEDLERLRESEHIDNFSDGVKAFCGIVMAVTHGDFSTVVIDEPEAFLHPPLSRRLGAFLAGRTRRHSGTLIAATHSAEFLLGCLQSTQDLQILRMEYIKGFSRARLLSPDELRSVFLHPLMRSTNAISSVFYDGVVLAEDDNDRAFYAEIYHRIAEVERVPSLLFLNARNKHSILEMMGPLRKFGLPAVGIVDIDFVKDGGQTFGRWLAAAGVPEGAWEALRQSRKSVFDSFSGSEMKRGGTALLGSESKIVADDFFDSLDKYGLLVVRRGELECWLPELNAVGKKTDWTIDALTKLGTDPDDPAYVRPGKGDVWDFIRKVCQYVSDPNRRGIYGG